MLEAASVDAPYADPLEGPLTTLVRSWRLIALSSLFMGICALAVASLMPRVYRAQVLMVPVIGEASQGQLGSLTSAMSGVTARLGLLVGASGSAALAEEEALATVTSYAFLESFIQDLDLLPVLFADKWNASASQWKVRDSDDVPTVTDAYELLKRDVISIDRDVRTGLVTLSVEWRDPKVAANWANTLVRRVNEVLRQRAIKDASATLEYLHNELERDPRIELHRSIYEAIEASINRIAMANVRHEFAFRVIDAAVPPRIDDYERPKILLLGVIGAFLGAFLGFVFALMRGVAKPSSQTPHVQDASQ